MELFLLHDDVPLVCLQATSFPEGVLAAHQQLHALIPFSPARRYYGISFPDVSGTIIYRAAAEVLDDSDTGHGLATFLLRKGNYSSLLIENFMDHIPAIGAAFSQLLQDPRIDPQGACVEWYVQERDLRCMVRLADEQPAL